MRFLSNSDVSALLGPGAVVDALRAGYGEYRAGLGAQLPRADLLTAAADDGFYRLGVMAGVSRTYDTAVVRIKSDVVKWTPRTEEKQAGRLGQYSGTVIAFRISDGVPMAIVQDGIVQHLRVAGAAALGTDLIAPDDVERVAVLGSGGMASSIMDALEVVRSTPSEVTVYSPNPAHRRAFARSLVDRLDSEVAPVDSAESAVRGAELVISATSSLEPTIQAGWLDMNTHVTAVSRREIGSDIRARADLLACLGPGSYPADCMPGMEPTRGGYSAFLALTDSERSHIPAPRASDTPNEYPLMLHGPPWPERPRPYLSILTAVGTQGIQFASTIGALIRLAQERDVGTEIPDELFLHEVRS